MLGLDLGAVSVACYAGGAYITTVSLKEEAMNIRSAKIGSAILNTAIELTATNSRGTMWCCLWNLLWSFICCISWGYYVWVLGGSVVGYCAKHSMPWNTREKYWLSFYHLNIQSIGKGKEEEKEEN